jgi:uncharacterized protein YbjT (DUF2867 family)
MAVSGIAAVVGATGQQGGAVARTLLGEEMTVRALVRDPAKAAAQALAAAGAQLAIADFDDPETLRSAFGGVSRLFAMTTMESGRGTSGETADGIALTPRRRRPSSTWSTARSAAPSATPGSRISKASGASNSTSKVSVYLRLSFGPRSSTRT